MRKVTLYVALLTGFLLSGCGDAESSNNAHANQVRVNETNSDATTVEKSKTSTDTSTLRPEDELPPFPFPPNASAEYPIDAALVSGPNEQKTFGMVDDRLRQALSANGYEQLSYYGVPGGFVITTAMEQFESTGKPVERDRFAERISSPNAFSAEFWRNAVAGRTGCFRVISFMITDRNFVSTNKTPLYAEGRDLVVRGANILPPEMRELPFTPRHRCVALVYEYGQDRGTGEMKFLRPGSLPAKVHLRDVIDSLRRG
jgi:hypothetical protein